MSIHMIAMVCKLQTLGLPGDLNGILNEILNRYQEEQFFRPDDRSMVRDLYVMYVGVY